MNGPNPTPNPTPNRRSCWFYGCISMAVIGVVGLGLLLLGGFWIKKSIAQAIQRYTDTKPVALEQVQLDPVELTNLQQRVAAFAAALEQPKTPQELVLSAHDINGLITHDPKYKNLSGKLHVRIEGDQVKGNLSVPLSEFGFSSLQGRYLNGLATFKIGLSTGQLSVKVLDLQANGQPVPQWLLQRLQDENLAREINQKPEIQAVTKKFDSIRVENGQVILRSKGQM